MPKIDSSKRLWDEGGSTVEANGFPGESAEAAGMPPPQQPREYLRWLLDYEIRGSERYRRFLSLLLIASNRNERGIEPLKESFRRSDEVIEIDKWHAAVLLRETNIDGTLNALNRFKAFHNVIHLRFAVVCYPTDGWNAHFILDSAGDRIARAMHGPAGAVVC